MCVSDHTMIGVIECASVWPSGVNAYSTDTGTVA
ncbi:hypothetical protein DM56_2623 [Burkholderia mallei]|nr:hypothetical protein DM56_2623 [Burkholderia mallei]CAJ3479076.1 Uncharacterised protein [Burkholderia pseudomallei]